MEPACDLTLPDAWTQAAARLPVAFAQVREDPAVDAEILADLGGRARVIMIASGGDTAALLVAKQLASVLHLVDANPAQLDLTRLKLRLLRQTPPPGRAALLGHRPMLPHERAGGLAARCAELSLPAEVFGPPEFVARVGPDHAGRYEVLFAQLRASLAAQRHGLASLLDLSDPFTQSRRAAPGTRLGNALDAAFDETMRLANLVALFGPEATRNPAQSFSRHFAERTRWALDTFPARSNPFLAQLLLDPPTDAGFPDWMCADAPTRWPETIFTHATMVDTLRAQPPEEADYVGLSNILDWLSPEAASETLELAWRALRLGGIVVVRQLNSRLEIPPLGRGFDWQAQRAQALHRRDRSFFYRALHVGLKSRA